MTGFLDWLNGGKRIVCDLGDALRLWQSCLAPDLRRVTAIPEVLQALHQAPLLSLESCELEGRRARHERNCCFAEILDSALYVEVRAASEVARSRAANTPDEGAISGVELLHAFIGLDDLRTADADPRMLGNDNAAAAGGDDAAAAEGSSPTANQGKHGDASAAHFDDCVDDFRDRSLARVCFLKPHAACIEQEQHGAGCALSSDVACGPQ